MFTSAQLLTLSAGLAAAAPFSFPLSNGFPNLTPGSPATKQVQTIAGGTLGNGPAPTGLAADTVNTFGLIALNEILEVAFFSELVSNITSGVDNYQLPPLVAGYTIDALNAVVAQEELHAVTANAIRQANGASMINGCTFQFPVSDFESAIALAQTLTDVVLGVLQDVEANAITANGAGAAGLVAGVSSILGQEGQQDGYYRAVQSKRPSAQPFLTGGARAFAFNAVSGFIVGDCPSVKDINFPVFQKLNVMTQDPCTSQTIFLNATNTPSVKVDPSSQKLVYLNGANLPNVTTFSIDEGQSKGDTKVISAYFPHDENVMDGLTIAAIVDGSKDLSSNDAVAAATLFGPGLIEVN